MDELVARIRKEHLGLEPPAPHLERFAAKCDSYAVGTSSLDELQLALCTYLDESARRNRALSRVINRAVEPPLGDLLTEAVSLVLHGVSRSGVFARRNVSVHSERGVRVGETTLKPDVSLWCGDAPFVVVECKTNMGRARDKWLAKFETRERVLQGVDIGGVFLFVATEHNWTGFPESDARRNESWFALCPKMTWPGGGKTKGVVPLAEKTNQGMLAKLVKQITRRLAAKS